VSAVSNSAQIATRSTEGVPAQEQFRNNDSLPDTSQKLDLAMTTGDVKTVQQLLDSGAHIEGANKRGLRMLHVAVRHEVKEVVCLLLERGADIESEGWNGWKALHYTTKIKNNEIAQLLLNWGANIEAGDDRGWKALHIATDYAHDDVIRFYWIGVQILRPWVIEDGSRFILRRITGMTK
jgi:ankyrin repeat protein